MGYTNSNLVTYTKISPNKDSPRNHIIDTITIHCYVGQVTAESGCNARHFVNYDYNNGASCNYVVGYDGSIGLCVDEKDRSWCSSSGINDNRAITIEVACEPYEPYEVTDKAMSALIDLVTDICKRNNIKELKWSTNKYERINHTNGCNMTVHRDFANKSCPGDYLYNRHGYIANEVNKRLGEEAPKINSHIVSSTLPASSNSKNILKGQKAVNKFVGCKISTDGIRGNETKKAAVMVVQTAINKDYGAGLVVDGIWGYATDKAFGSHYVKVGETQWMVTALEILCYLKGKDPKGIEYPGTFGQGLKKAVGSSIAKKATFKKLCS